MFLSSFRSFCHDLVIRNVDSPIVHLFNDEFFVLKAYYIHGHLAGDDFDAAILEKPRIGSHTKIQVG